MFGFHINSISDVDECLGVNDCQQECKNIPGSYNCGCYTGFELSSDQKNCNGRLFMLSIKTWLYYIILLLLPVLTTCPVSNNCSHICAIVDGFPTCFCNLGYELAFENNAQCVGKLLLDDTKSRDFYTAIWKKYTTSLLVVFDDILL